MFKLSLHIVQAIRGSVMVKQVMEEVGMAASVLALVSSVVLV